MPKVDSRRFKYHQAAKKRQEKNPDGSAKITAADQPAPHTSAATVNPSVGSEIDLDRLIMPPPQHWDRKTLVGIHKKITQGKNKKEKARARRSLLLKRLEASDAIIKEMVESKRREEASIAEPDASVEHNRDSQQRSRDGQGTSSGVEMPYWARNRTPMKRDRKHKDMLQDIDVFNKVLQDEHFKANPGEIMLNHLSILIQREYLDELNTRKQ
ncbi:uncharacterized protein LOC100900081 [Galendromus occidentalis]|uniref:Uncharacterized protein LOC100900081 n=1 Tax=Galendromus occidentalis TaxID=34638 RepID=A0AAJ6QYD6_9ACAR|nr:uncharacterized protein LOC100900081 [Galendromus occidentalis]